MGAFCLLTTAAGWIFRYMIDSKAIVEVSGITLLVAPCSARKMKLPVASLCANKLPRGTQAAVAEAWLARLASAPRERLTPSRELYAGRTYQRIRALSEQAGYRLLVISAGLGLVESSTAVPSYDLTLSPSAMHSLRTKIASRIVPSAWWEAVQQGPYATSVAALGKGNGRVLVALTHSYAEMVGRSLASLPPSVRGRLRIFGSGLAPHLPAVLHPQIIIYDGRLERVIAGTRLDAASRAMAHFVDIVGNSPATTVDADRAAIDAALSDIAPPITPFRKRASDATLMQYIVRFVRSGLSATNALKRLRAEALIACEERRFRRLYDEVSS